MREIDPDLIRREAAAAILGISVRQLDRLTAQRKVPEPYKYGPNCSLFSEREILAHREAGQRKAG